MRYNYKFVKYCNVYLWHSRHQRLRELQQIALYQRFYNILQNDFHNNSNALIAQQTAHGMEMWGAHEASVLTILCGVGCIKLLGTPQIVV